ncbi:MAG: alpha/beta hydrolase [Bryobacterales bacterium]|nr:alpha/beta hydrolase [Bryobacterales bacterium]
MFVHQFVKGEGPHTLLLLHGTGGDERDLLDLGRELAPRAHLLSPRGKVLENGMPRFFRRLRPGVFDLEDLRLRTTELAEFVREAAGQYGFDAGKVTALGYSNGANIAASLLYREPGVLAGAALLRPMNPWPGEAAQGLEGVRVLLAAGRYDTMSSPGDVAEMRKVFEGAGAQVEEHWHEGGHELGPGDLAATGRWLATA